MKKILVITILTSIFSCTPYQKLVMMPVNRNPILTDNCDLLLMKRLKPALDTIEFNQTLDQSKVLEDIIEESECKYYANKFYPPHGDSSIWLVTIRPASLGKDEFILGSLYTIYPGEDSTFNFIRRMKVYSQKNDFESGKYIVFSYIVTNDTTTVVKKGFGLF